eukprot:sb/3461817/
MTGVVGDPLLSAQLQDMFPEITADIIDGVIGKFQSPERATEELLIISNNIDINPDYVIPPEYSNPPPLTPTASPPVTPVKSEQNSKKRKSEQSAVIVRTEETLPPDVLEFRSEAFKELEAAKTAASLDPKKFVVDSVTNIDLKMRLTDRTKLFFGMMSGLTAEVKSIRMVTSHHASTKFWEKASALNCRPKVVELYRPVALIPEDVRGMLQIMQYLHSTTHGVGLYELYSYAPPTVTPCTQTLIVCNVLLGSSIQTEGEGGEEDTLPLHASYSSQILVKYLVDVTTKRSVAAARRAARYTDVPEVLWEKLPGSIPIHMANRNLRNVGDPFNEILMHAQSIFDGACLKRTMSKHHPHQQQKPKPKTIEIVICPKIWAVYERTRAQMGTTGGVEEIFAFHATDNRNVPSIIQNNLDWTRAASHGRAYGDGCYFSEFPEFSAKYNHHCIMIFKLILVHFQVIGKFQSPERATEELLIISNNIDINPDYVIPPEYSNPPPLTPTASPPVTPVKSEQNSKKRKSEQSAVIVRTEETLPPDVLEFRSEAFKELEAAKTAASLDPKKFVVDSVTNIDLKMRLTDRTKLFFGMMSGLTAEVKSIRMVTSHHASTKFWEKASALNCRPKVVELYRPVALIPEDVRGMLQIMQYLHSTTHGVGLYELYSYAPPTVTPCTQTLIVCNVLLGSSIQTEGEGGEEDTLPLHASYSSQILVKYLVDVTTKRSVAAARRAARYTDVPEVLWEKLPGSIPIHMANRNLRNVGDPFNEILMHAQSIFDGACLKRTMSKHHPHQQQKPKPKTIEIVICPKIWAVYERTRAQMGTTGAVEEIFAFHATDNRNVPSIIQNNLDWTRAASHGRAYGDGCYFSEFPEFSAKYNHHCIMIFKLILVHGAYTKVKQTHGGFCEQIVISDTTLFKPVYVLHF